eukprot:1728847-Pyramimonas_sp.AAC.2
MLHGDRQVVHCMIYVVSCILEYLCGASFAVHDAMLCNLSHVSGTPASGRGGHLAFRQAKRQNSLST